ncbi:MAG: TonB-dependent receptor family protein [Crocinitomicaceae bacterium]|nr:TonB-dependent receptor [Crocinitomicaceae bacterium]
MLRGLFLLFTLFSIAYGFTSEVVLPGKFLIKGKVINKKDSKAIEYATIRIYNVADSSMVTGGVTDSTGHFKIDLENKGDFYALINFLGFKEKSIGNINFEQSKVVDLGTIELALDEEMLEEVVVESAYNNVEYHLDKKVVNVDNQITAQGGSAVEVLENLPSVKVDIDGNVSLRGSTGFLVLINGKPSVLDPTDALRQIPASSIQRIELITNPSSKYVPDGVGGIINIILKKNRANGFSGNLNGNVGSFGTYGADALFNYKKNKITFTFGGDYNQNKGITDVEDRRETILLDTTTFQTSEGYSGRQRGGGSGRIGLDVDFTENDLLTIEGRVGVWSMKHDRESDYATYTNPADTNLNQYVTGLSKYGGLYYNTSINYIHKFKKPKHEISIQGTYGNRNNAEFNETYLYPFRNGPVYQASRLDEVGPSHSVDTRLDYSVPFAKTFGIDMGLQFRYNFSADDVDISDYDTTINDMVVDSSKSNNINYTRYVPGAYFIIKGEFKNFGFQAGVRSEYTHRDVYSITQDSTVSVRRLDFFPSVHLSYNFKKEFQIMASYTRRINRPKGWNLEPFITWTDLFNVRQGNPELLPEYIESFELNMVKTWKKVRLSFETYYRLTNNRINRIQSAYSDGVILTKYENVGKSHSLGMEAMANFTIFKWWELSLSGNGFFYRIEGFANGEDIFTQSFNWTALLSMTFKVNKMLRFQIDGNYTSAGVTTQGRDEDYFVVNFGIRSSFLKNTLNVTANVRDLFATGRRISISEDPTFYSYQYRFSRAPQFTISLSYRFNNFNQKKRQNSEDDGY